MIRIVNHNNKNRNKINRNKIRNWNGDRYEHFCLINCGGDSSSSVEQRQDTKVINKSSVDFLNQQIQNTIVNTTLDFVKSCSASLINTQSIKITGIRAGEDVTITTKQAQQGMLDFGCAQNSTVKNDVSASIVSKLLSDITNNVDTNVLSSFEATANATSDQGWLTLPSLGDASSSDANVVQTINNNIRNESDKTFENLIKTRVEANYTQSVHDDCLAKVISSQEFVTSNVIAGRNVTLTVDQQQAAQLYSKCIQSNGVSNRITNDILSFLDVNIVDDVQTTSKTDLTGGSESKNIIAGLDNAINNIFNGLFGWIPGLAALGTMGKYISSSVSSFSSLFCFIIIIMIIAVPLMKK